MNNLTIKDVYDQQPNHLCLNEIYILKEYCKNLKTLVYNSIDSKYSFSIEINDFPYEDPDCEFHITCCRLTPDNIVKGYFNATVLYSEFYSPSDLVDDIIKDFF